MKKKIFFIIVLIFVNILNVSNCNATEELEGTDWGVHLMSESLLSSSAASDFEDYDAWVAFMGDLKNSAQFNLELGINFLDESNAYKYFQNYSYNVSDINAHVEQVNKTREQNGEGLLELKKITIYKTVEDGENGTKLVDSYPPQYFYTYWDNQKKYYYTKEQYDNFEGKEIITKDWGTRLIYKSFINTNSKDQEGIDVEIHDAYTSMLQGKIYLEVDETFWDQNYFYKDYFSSDFGTTLDTHIEKVNEYRNENGKKTVELRKIDIYNQFTNSNGHTQVEKESRQYFYTYWDNENNQYYTMEQYKNPDYKKSDDYGIWGAASEWFGESKGSYTLPQQVSSIIDTFTDMINIVGTTVIVIATIVLGIKYMIGTVDSRTSAKEGLITLLVACVFFFGWTAISNLLYGGENLDFIFTSESDSSYTDMVGRIFSTFTYVAQFVAIGVVIFIGIKYIFAGAEGKAELKGKSIYFIIGIILVFATSNVLSFISKIINEAI